MRLAVAPTVQRPLMPAPRGLIQRCACGGTPGPDGECAECKRKRLMRLASGPGPASPTPLVVAVVRSPGQPLDPGTRAFMEARFTPHAAPASPRPALAASGPISRPGDPLEREAHRVASQVMTSPRPAPSGGGVDFSRVRVHTDERAAASARSVDAHAYTVGSHIAFDRGRYAPGTPGGRSLIAHELAHVVQQGDLPRGRTTPILRQSKCDHDGFPQGCGHAWKLPGELKFKGVDKRIIETLDQHLPGRWAEEIESPLNRRKSDATQRGRVDALKVVEQGGELRLEVIEVKPRSTGQGCVRASYEADGYVLGYTRIVPQILAISRAAEQLGGLRPPGGKVTPGQVRQLRALGIDLADPDTADAFRFWNSLQNRLDTIYTRAFTNVVFSVNADGVRGFDYTAATVEWNCVRNKVIVSGHRDLIFQINREGGLSYRCRTECPDNRDRKPQEEPIQIPIGKDVETGRGVEVEGDEPVEEPGLPDQPPLEAPPADQPAPRPRGDRPTVPTPPPVQAPPAQQPPDQPVQFDQPGGNFQGVPELIVTLAATSQYLKAVRAAQLARTISPVAAAVAEGKLVKSAIEVIDLIGKDAPQVAKNLRAGLTTLGTEAGDDVIKAAAQEVDDLAAKAVSRGGGKVAGALKTLGRVTVVLTVLLTASQVHAMVNHLRKGGDIRIGLGGPEAELVGETKITKRGQQPFQKLDVAGSGTLKDTIVDIDVTGLPDLSGKAQIQAENVTIRQAGMLTNGDPITVNIRAKLKNTTIVIKHRARFKDGKAVIGGEAVDISDSNIEIDLPEGVTLPEGKSRGPMQNVQLKITEVPKEPAAGPTGTGGPGGGPEATATPTPTPAPKPEAKPKPPEPDPGAKYKGLDDDTREKIRTATKPVQTLFEELTKPVPKQKGIPVNNETVTRFYDTVPPGLDEAQLEELRKHMVPLTTDSVDDWFKGLEDAVRAVTAKADAAASAGPEGKTVPKGDMEAGEEGQTPAEIIDQFRDRFELMGNNMWVVDFSGSQRRAEEAVKKGKTPPKEREAAYLRKTPDGVETYASLKLIVVSRGKRRIEVKIVSATDAFDATGKIWETSAELKKKIKTGRPYQWPRKPKP